MEGGGSVQEDWKLFKEFLGTEECDQFCSTEGAQVQGIAKNSFQLSQHQQTEHGPQEEIA